MKRISLFLALCFFGSQLPAAEKRPMKTEDLMSLVRIGDPQISPDGKWIAYVQTRTLVEKNSRSSDIFLVSAEGGESRQLTFSSASSDTPRWSPDGKTLAYLSGREQGSQIWLLSMAGGEARRLTSLSTEAGGPICWSPDSRYLAFVSDVYPECQDEECNRRKDQDRAESKVQARTVTRLPYRVWNRWRDGKQSHLFIVTAAGGTPRDITPGDGDVPPIDLGGPQDYSFSPDGNEVCFTRTADAEIALSTNHDLWTVPTGGGSAVRITSSPAADNTPKYSPDGRWIAYRAQTRPGYEADRWRLMLYERKTGQSRSLTESWDRSISDFQWAPDAKALYLIADERGRSSLFSLRLEEGASPVRRMEKGSQGSPQISADGRLLVYLQQSLTAPPEVFVAGVDGMQPRAVTAVNRSWREELDMPVPEDISWKGAEGAAVQGWLVKPPQFRPDARYPLVLLIHGGPQGAWEDSFSTRWNPVLWAAQGYVVLAANPRGSTSFGQRFTDEISGDWGGKAFADLMAGVDHLIGLGFTDSSKMAAAGGSYGGYMVNWMLGHTDRFKAFVSHAGVYNLESMYGATEELWFTEWEFQGTPWGNPESYRRWSPHLAAGKFKTPTLVIHGEQDFRVPVGEGLQLFTALQRQKVPSKLLYFPDEGHWVLKPRNSLLWHRTIFDWLRIHLR